MHVCLTIKYYKIMGGDKIVLLDGAGANGGAGAIVKNMIPAFPFFPFGKKGIKKMLYRSAGNRIPVAGLFHITFFWI
jgi:hypothetical protein